MTAVLSSLLASPGFALADPLPGGGWVKRGRVPASALPRYDGEQRPCPSNGRVGRYACTGHTPGLHVAVSLGRILGAKPDTAVA